MAKAAFQMDPVESINIERDTTFVLALEAQARGYEVYHYLPSALSYVNGEVVVRARKMRLQPVKGAHYELGPEERVSLADMNVVMMRQDPPFDMSYIAATHLLELLPQKTRVVNNPAAVRNAPEKLLTTRFAKFCPKTLITRDMAEIERFRAETGEIIIKPLFDFGGAGVFHIKRDDRNLHSLVEMFLKTYREPFVVQEYLPAVAEGDKRVMLVAGKPVGALNRVTAPHEVRSNLRTGSVAEKTVITKKEREAAEAVGEELARRGILLAGLDFIGERLTEINVTCPTGIQQINRFDGVRVDKMVWDEIEGGGEMG